MNNILKIGQNNINYYTSLIYLSIIMKHYNKKILTFKEKHYSQLPTSVQSYCREKLQDSIFVSYMICK